MRDAALNLASVLTVKQQLRRALETLDGISDTAGTSVEGLRSRAKTAARAIRKALENGQVDL